MQNITSNTIVADGIRKFIRLQALPMPLDSQIKWSADPSDLIAALHTTKQCFADTHRMVDGQMYQNTPYVHTEDVKCAIEELLLVGEDDHESALLRRKNLSMYHLVIEPFVDMFATVDHATALPQVDALIDSVIHIITTTTEYGHVDDAIVAQHQVRAMVRERADRRAAQKTARKRNTKRKEVVESIPDEE